MWIWALASGLAAAVVAQGALPGALVFVLAVILLWLLLRRARHSTPQAEASRSGPLQPSAAMARAVLGATDEPDDLHRIKCLGLKLAPALEEAGIRSSAWTPDKAAAMDKKFGARGRVLRDDLVAQARALALGDHASTSVAPDER